MKRFCSQIIYCSPEKILRQAVVEQNNFGMINDLFLLNTRYSESAQTLFVDGIISTEILSLKRNLAPEKLCFVQSNYQYIDLSAGFLPNEFSLTEKKLLLDFGTNSVAEINEILQFSFPFLARFSIFDILTACVYYPTLELIQSAELQMRMKTNLMQWKGIDLVSKKLTERTLISKL